jgi:hypothetical protein
MRSRFLTILNEVEAELRRADRASPYFTLLRPNYVDDLMRIEGLGGAILEIGGYPFCFSMCLRKLGFVLTTVDLAPQRAQDLIREYSLRVVTCDMQQLWILRKPHSLTSPAISRWHVSDGNGHQ